MWSGLQFAGRSRSWRIAFEGGIRINRIVTDQCLFKVVHVEKVGELIAVGLPHFSAFDQFEDDATEIICRFDTPVLEYGFRQHPKFLESQLPDTLQQFGTADVCRIILCILRSLFQSLLRELQSFKDESVSIRMKFQPRWA